MKYGTMIKQIREDKKISKEELAKKAGCSKRAIEYWENGKREISLHYADKVFKALDTTISIGMSISEEEKRVC